MNLKDKASKIKFPLNLPETKSEPIDPSTYKNKTAPGAMMAFANERRSEMLIENEELKKKAETVDLLQARLTETLEELKQWDGAKGVRELDPKLVVRSKFANRHELNFGGAEFLQLKEEISNAGKNIQPIKVRPLKTKSGEGAYEIVYGHRRHEACLQLGIPVHALIDNLDDQSLFVEMDRENRARKDLSAWEQGTMYKRALDQGLFPSNRKLADAIGVDLSALGKALTLAQLPDEIIAAFESPMDIQYKFAKPLRDALDTDLKGCIERAKKIASIVPKLKANEILSFIITPALGGVEPFHPP